MRTKSAMSQSECEKIIAVKDQSQSIGGFLEWLESQGIHLATFHEHSEDCRSEHRRDYTCGYSEAHMQPYRESTEKLLARHFNIDLDKVEKEKQ